MSQLTREVLLARLIAETIPEGLVADPILRRCAVPRSFDLTVFHEVLRSDAGADITFEELKRYPEIEAIPNSDRYRVCADRRHVILQSWQLEPHGLKDLLNLRVKLIKYYGDRPLYEAESLHQVAVTDPTRAARIFDSEFSSARESFDLARCADLLGALTDHGTLPESLSTSARWAAKELDRSALWADDFYRTARYFQRSALAHTVDSFLSASGCWILNFHAPGGMGKTMFLRWLVSRELVRLGIPCTRVDCDFLDLKRISSEPWRLIHTFARQLNKQLPQGALSAALMDAGDLELASSGVAGDGGEITARIGRGLAEDCDGPGSLESFRGGIS